MNDDYDDDNGDGLEDLVDQIQVGDRTEGAQAIREIGKRFSADPQAIERTMRQVQARDRVQHEVDSALNEFARKNPNLVQDELLAEAGMTAVRNEIARDLEQLGVPRDKLDPLKRSNEHMIGAYAHLRAAGQRVRAPGEILDAAAQEMRSKFNIRTPSSRDPQQVVREMRESRGFKNEEHVAPARPAADDPRRARTLAAINQARKARGFDLYE